MSQVESLRGALHRILRPRRESEIPVPGFSSGDALVAWARSQPRPDVIEALLDELMDGGLPQQLGVVVALRGLGVDIDGRDLNGRRIWEVSEGNSVVRRIVPRHQPRAIGGLPEVSLAALIESAMHDVQGFIPELRVNVLEMAFNSGEFEAA